MRRPSGATTGAESRLVPAGNVQVNRVNAPVGAIAGIGRPATSRRRLRPRSPSATPNRSHRTSAFLPAACAAELSAAGRDVPSVACARLHARSRADWNRASGAFCSRRMTMRASAGGTRSLTVRRSAGSRVRMACSVSKTLAPRNGCWPASISYIITPSANRSARGSGDSPRACSGAMYAAVPATMLSAVSSGARLRTPRPAT